MYRSIKMSWRLLQFDGRDWQQEVKEKAEELGMGIVCWGGGM
jgi:hypothetical protein